ncbi:hypothetical protein TSUD_417040, partial [Trifolium subterraneum]
MAQLFNDLNDWKQRLYQQVADLIKEVEDGLNLNEDLSNNQKPSTSEAEQNSNIESTATTACFISDDNESIQRAKVNGLLDQYEEFRMEENESIGEMSSRLQAITSKLEEFDNKLSNKELVSKMLRSLPLEWNIIAKTIEETKDINSMSPESLIELLKDHELALKDKEELKSEEAQAARKGKQAKEHEDLDEEPDEEYLERFSRKLQKWYNFKKNGGAMAKGMITWEELDNFSEGESEGEKEIKLSGPEEQMKSERALGAEESCFEDGSDSEDSSSDGESDSDNLDHIKGRLNQPIKFDFPDEDTMVLSDEKVIGDDEGPEPGAQWKLAFDAASNAMGHGIGAVLISPRNGYTPFTTRLCFDCTNNMAEYEACIMGLEAAINHRIKILEVYGDSALVIYQVKGEWETRHPKLIPYRAHVVKLTEYFDEITFHHIPREENQVADALATLSSMYKVRFWNEAPMITVERKDEPVVCTVVEEEHDDKPWFYDIKRY